MIVDTAKVSFMDGSKGTAMEVYTGAEILSFGNGKATRARVIGKEVSVDTDAMGLILSSGEKLCGSRKQKVATFRGKHISYRALEDIEVGDTLRGERAGMPVTLTVTGLVFYPRKEVRVVSFTTDHDKPYVAEGVLCRS